MYEYNTNSKYLKKRLEKDLIKYNENIVDLRIDELVIELGAVQEKILINYMYLEIGDYINPIQLRAKDRLGYCTNVNIFLQREEFLLDRIKELKNRNINFKKII